MGCLLKGGNKTVRRGFWPRRRQHNGSARVFDPAETADRRSPRPVLLPTDSLLVPFHRQDRTW